MRTKSETRRQAILDSATKVFQETGFERASMSEICQRLGCSKATLYSYFPSKEALFFEVLVAASEAEFTGTLAALDPSIDDITQALENFGRRFLVFIYSERVQAVRRLVMSEAGRADMGPTCYDLGPVRSETAVAAFLQQAMDAGKLRQADPRLAGMQLRALLEAEWVDRFMFHLLTQLPLDEMAQTVQRAVHTFMAAYGPQPSPRTA